MSKVLDLWSGMTGTVLPFAGAAAPNGWLLCYGKAVNRADYPNLFAAIGTTFGACDGSTTFNLPDLRGRVPAGKDNMGGTPANRLTTAGSGVDGPTLGAAGGSQAHTLTTAQMPAHAHTATDAGHSHGVTDPTHAHTVYDPGHSHTYDRITASQPNGSGVSNTTSTTNNTTTNTGAATTGIGIYAAATGISVNNGSANISVASQGGGGAHNNTQPTIVLNHIIKA